MADVDGVSTAAGLRSVVGTSVVAAVSAKERLAGVA